MQKPSKSMFKNESESRMRKRNGYFSAVKKFFNGKKKRKKNYEKKSIGIGQRVEIENLIIFIVSQYIKIYDRTLNLFPPFLFLLIFNFVSFLQKKKKKKRNYFTPSSNVHDNIIDILFLINHLLHN